MRAEISSHNHMVSLYFNCENTDGWTMRSLDISALINFLGWDMFLISCELWFVIVLGWLGGWKKLLPISFSCSWKLLCYASSYVTQPIRWWFAVLQKEKTSQESWRWRKNLWRRRYGCSLLIFHGISYSIMSHIGFSSSFRKPLTRIAKEPWCHDWVACLKIKLFFYQWYHVRNMNEKKKNSDI